MLYYTPLEQAAAPVESMTPTLFFRANSGDQESLIELREAARREIHALDQSLRAIAVRSFEEVVAPQLRSWRLGAILFSAFGVLALAVASVGVYSVHSFEVASRRREIGIRSALGASRQRIVRWIVTDSAKLLLASVVLGIGAASLLTPLLGSMLYGVEPVDPASLLAASALLLGVGLAATWLPARSAAQVDPATTLRED